MNRNFSLPPAIILTGPTAAGKTAIAMALADRFDVDLISVDSAQVYRGFDIGSAKPDPETLLRYPHALISVREPDQPYSVADFVDDCDQLIVEANARGRLPVLVGGTTLYLRSALYGLDAMPRSDARIRAQISSEVKNGDWQKLHAELAASDPVAGARITVSDPQRLLRAIEVLRLSGKGPSHWQQNNRVPRFDSLRLVVTPASRSTLHARIGQRFEQMIEQGFMAEAEMLFNSPCFDPDLPSFRCVGYRQAWDYLNGEIDLETLAQKVGAATRQLAKRQLTALRQMHTSLWYDASTKSTFDRIYRQVQGFFANYRSI